MKQLIIGLTVGAIAGAIAYKKMDDNKVPEKVLKKAQKKLKEN
ncbi:MAG: hypothetical protein OSJ83_05115 [Clostridia bacterium]|nr:hypothetical protein [Clostridia bacterium]